MHFLATDAEFRKGREEMALHFAGSKSPEGEAVTAGQLQAGAAEERPQHAGAPGAVRAPGAPPRPR
ncbi:hypothetical protein ACFWP3_12720 [Streptomyces sp. NPDC058525]|uniref:hypothetical protein n=1 Tax=Streptomyces sp. NPDC058525 TaxID=3346538 RepID=UPI00365287CA